MIKLFEISNNAIFSNALDGLAFAQQDNADVPSEGSADSSEKDIDFGEFTNTIIGSPGEIKLLFELSERRRVIDQREHTLLEREKSLQAFEVALKEKNTQLIALKGEIERLLERFNQRTKQEAITLRNIYSGMKPKAAAAIFNQLDIDTLVAVISGMKPRDTAPIIAAMNIEKARSLTTELLKSIQGRAGEGDIDLTNLSN